MLRVLLFGKGLSVARQRGLGFWDVRIELATMQR